MAKAAGIVAAIIGLFTLPPITVMIGFAAIPVMIILSISAIVVGIVGRVTGKGDPKAPALLGIIFGAMGLVVNLIVWPFVYLLQQGLWP